MKGSPKDGDEREKTAQDTAASTRREFLRQAGIGTAAGLFALSATRDALAVPQTPAKVGTAQMDKLMGARIKPTVPAGKGRIIGANDRMNIAVIGTGGQGGAHLYLLLENRKENNAYPIAVCDCYQKRLDGAAKTITNYEPDTKVLATRQYREILANKDIDAVLIATPEHWHAQIAVDAMEAGKHVYIEKPMTRYLNEAFAIEDTARRTGRVVQVGSQGCQEQRWHVAQKAIADGKIGQIVSCQGSYTRNSRDGEWNYHIDDDASPENLDWLMWQGSCEIRPWNEDSKSRFFRYRKYRAYSAGLIGDLLPHKLHPMMLAMFGDKPPFPAKVTTLATKNIKVPGDTREVADTVHVLVEFATGSTMYVLLSTVNEQGLEDVIRGHEGTVRFGGNRVTVSPERPFAEERDEEQLPVNDPGSQLVYQEKDWLNAIRTGKQPVAGPYLAIPVQTIVCMAEMSEMFGKTIFWDAAKKQPYTMGAAGKKDYIPV